VDTHSKHLHAAPASWAWHKPGKFSQPYYCARSEILAYLC
jgi:hypothetical protein